MSSFVVYNKMACVTCKYQHALTWECGNGSTHDNPLRLQSISVARDALPERVRVPLAHLVLPHDHRLVHRPRVHEDPRDVRPDVLAVRNQVPRRAVRIYTPRHLLDRLGRLAAQREREVELHPPPDVDERMRHAELLDVLPDLQFLKGSNVSADTRGTCIVEPEWRCGREGGGACNSPRRRARARPSRRACQSRTGRRAAPQPPSPRG